MALYNNYILRQTRYTSRTYTVHVCIAVLQLQPSGWIWMHVEYLIKLFII